MFLSTCSDPKCLSTSLIEIIDRPVFVGVGPSLTTALPSGRSQAPRPFGEPCRSVHASLGKPRSQNLPGRHIVTHRLFETFTHGGHMCAGRASCHRTFPQSVASRR